MIVSILVIVVTLLIYYECIFGKRTRYLGKKIPGPKLWPVIGNAYLIFDRRFDLFETISKYYDKYGERFRIFLGHKLIVVVSNPKDVYDVLSNDLERADDYHEHKEWMGSGLVLADYGTAKTYRKIIASWFHLDNLKQLIPAMVEETDMLLQNISKYDGKEAFDVNIYTKKWVTGFVAFTYLGIRLDDSSEEAVEFMAAVAKLWEGGEEKMKNIMYRFACIYDRTQAGRTFKNSVKLTINFTDKIVTDKMAQFRKKLENGEEIKSGKESPCLVDYLISSKYENGEYVDCDFVKSHLITLIVATSDSTSSAIPLVLYALSRHRDAQMKVYNEQLHIFGKDRQRSPTLTEINDMKYIEMFVKETLRMYPVGTTIGRKVKQERDLNGMVLPRGCNVLVSVLNMCRNPKWFPDPSKFDPERFSPQECSKRPLHAAAVFSGGPRGCMGPKMAMMMIIITVSRIIRNYELLPGDVDMKIRYGVILKSLNGMYLRIVKRE